MLSFNRILPFAIWAAALQLCAQEQPKPEASKPAEGAKPAAAATRQGQAFVRRISAGVTLSVLGRPPIPERSTSQRVRDDLLIESTTQNRGFRLGGGIVAQAAVTDRFAVVVNGFYRRVRFEQAKRTFEGIDRANTPQDERRLTADVDKTRARFYDYTVMVRRFSKSRFEAGPRWFYEAGPAIRKTSNISTSRETTPPGQNTLCCTKAPFPVSKQTAKGIIAGVGLQFNDEIGIRIVPEFRYTRWFDQPFNSFSTITRRDQLEGMVSITF